MTMMIIIIQVMIITTIIITITLANVFHVAGGYLDHHYFDGV